MSIIAFNSRKRYTFIRLENENDEHPQKIRIEDKRGNIAGLLCSRRAVETVGKICYGCFRPDTNHCLKWAFSEAGNSVAIIRK